MLNKYIGGGIKNFRYYCHVRPNINKDDKFNLDFTKVGKNKFFYDVIYNPKETNFLKVGKKLGNITENGKLMFIYQAIAAFKIWHGIKPVINNETIELLN